MCYLASTNIMPERKERALREWGKDFVCSFIIMLIGAERSAGSSTGLQWPLYYPYNWYQTVDLLHCIELSTILTSTVSVFCKRLCFCSK